MSYDAEVVEYICKLAEVDVMNLIQILIVRSTLASFTLPPSCKYSTVKSIHLFREPGQRQK